MHEVLNGLECLPFVRSFITDIRRDKCLRIWTLPELPIDAKVQYESGKLVADPIEPEIDIQLLNFCL